MMWKLPPAIKNFFTEPSRGPDLSLCRADPGPLALCWHPLFRERLHDNFRVWCAAIFKGPERLTEVSDDGGDMKIFYVQVYLRLIMSLRLTPHRPGENKVFSSHSSCCSSLTLWWLQGTLKVFTLCKLAPNVFTHTPNLTTPVDVCETFTVLMYLLQLQMNGGGRISFFILKQTNGCNSGINIITGSLPKYDSYVKDLCTLSSSGFWINHMHRVTVERS